ncbi:MULTISPECIES: hypothetical protein [Pseudanabaena]|uniref:AbiTii domain-containing protein n=2 Tax=Pseudanabaena TaxID=1152 RepID=L8MXI8_9CYAN|nr:MULTISPECIES: hypothetical protein [Pseudanabaena]ELS32181.1 hypothetical protein Pse7429DRAFT_2595 [Pseudanabaena biceps PCC 7429]MDG3495582.1 hypothetical protein [Pseudanabaena catenata USMAC16]
MSVSESRIVPCIEDILASLEVRLELEESSHKLPLTRSLEKCLLFAEANKYDDLHELLKQEAYGYSNPAPNYRYVQLSYFDVGGQMVNGLSQYSSYPLVTGVNKLELHLKNGLTLMLPKQILAFLSKVSGREVDTGYLSPPAISNLLDIIRHEIAGEITRKISKRAS